MHKKVHIFYKLVLLVLVCVNTSCNKNKEELEQFERIDNLLSSNKDSMAVELFNQIVAPQDSSENLAFYNYILTRIKCRKNEILEPEKLDFSIKWLTEKKDYHRLAYAYIYKSKLFLDYSLDKYNALIYNDKAEKLLQNINDDVLKYNVYSHRSYIAMFYYDTDACKKYSLKALEIANKMQNPRRIAHESLFLSMCCLEQGNLLEAEKYIDKCLNFIDIFNDINKSMVYNTLGDIIKSKDSDLALKYYNKSNSFFFNPDACNRIALLYLEQNRLSEADSLFNKSLRPKAYESNTRLMKVYADKLFLTGNISKTLDIYRQMSAEKDSLYKVKEKNSDMLIEKAYKQLDQKNIEIISQEHIIKVNMIIIISLLILIFIIGAFYIQLKKQKQVEFIQCQQKVSKWERMLKQIENNQSISQWDKTDRKFFVEYYKKSNSEFTENICNNYESLPVNAEIFLILQNMGKNKQDIIDIMGFSDQAYRSLKSRIEKTRKQDNENQ